MVIERPPDGGESLNKVSLTAASVGRSEKGTHIKICPENLKEKRPLPLCKYLVPPLASCGHQHYKFQSLGETSSGMFSRLFPTFSKIS